VSEHLLQQITELSKGLDTEDPASRVRLLQQQVADLVQAVNDAVDQSATGSDPSGLVKATVRGRGAVESLYISPHAMRDLSADELGAACVNAVRAAKAAVAGQIEAALDPSLRDTP
jgi:DNA-binding protein YbaB